MFNGSSSKRHSVYAHFFMYMYVCNQICYLRTYGDLLYSLFIPLIEDR